MTLNSLQIGIIISIIGFTLLIIAGYNILKESGNQKKLADGSERKGVSAPSSAQKMHEVVW